MKKLLSQALHGLEFVIFYLTATSSLVYALAWIFSSFTNQAPLYTVSVTLAMNLAWAWIHLWRGSLHRPWSLIVVAPYILAFAVLVAGMPYLRGQAYPEAPILAPLILLALASYSVWFTRYAPWAISRQWIAPRESKPEASQTVAPAPALPRPSIAHVQPPTWSTAKELVPAITFRDLHGNEAIKARLQAAAQAIVQPEAGRQSRNGILLFGEPGNGKTVFAEALAGTLGLPMLVMTYAETASMWVGERTIRIKAAFDYAQRCQPCVFFIDEIDSFLESRTGRDDGIKDDRDAVNAMLTLMVEIRRSRVILIAATNHLDRLDSAGIREGRFDFKVEITPPDEAARIGLLNTGLRNNVKGWRVDPAVVESVARRWNGFSVKRILATTEELPSYLERQRRTPATPLVFEDFMGALRAVQGRRGVTLENVKPLEDLVLSPRTREAIDLIAGRMADPEHTERHGGTLPTGVLFYGPAGTGKTATCKALAKHIEWAFLPTTGADLARTPGELDKLYAKAKELRPTVVFIDEADELLRARNHSSSTEATNKLLTLMDGAHDRVRDVVWIAATNHPETIDPALLRGGRFAEKVVFELPSAAQLGEHIGKWLAARKTVLVDGLSAQSIGQTIGMQSIANAEAIIQAALNRAVSRRVTPVRLGKDDLDFGMRTVLDGSLS